MPRSLLVVFLQVPMLLCAGVIKAQPAIDEAQTSAPTEGAVEADPLDKADDADYYELLMAFADTIDQIDRNYVRKVSRRELLQAAIEGILTKLDPYSNYIAPDDLDEFKVEVENEFGGIGILIANRRNQLGQRNQLTRGTARATISRGSVRPPRVAAMN